MDKFKKLIIIAIGTFVFISLVFGAYKYHFEQQALVIQNICEDDELIARLIVDNANPFTKFKFIKKRNIDCKVLLINNKEEALNNQNQNFCSVLDASTNSLTMLIHTYVDGMYDRETASKEYKNMIPLMVPYNYCPNYLNDLYTLINIKKRLGL
jgi:hypothetical protein